MRLLALGFVLNVACLACGAGDDASGDDAVGGTSTKGGSGGSGTTGGSGGSGGVSSGGSASGGTSTGGTATGGGGASAGSGSGGTSNAGSGNGGSGGTLPKVVLDCDGLAGVDEFENITPPEADLSGNGITQVLLDPVHAGTVFVGADHKGLYKSTNCGADWVKVSTGDNADLFEQGTLWSAVIDYQNPDVIYGASLYAPNPSLHKSTNGGVDWTSLAPEGSEIATHVEYNFFQDLAIDPTNHEHLVISFHSDCKAPYPKQCMADTTDGGDNWRIFGGPFSSWSEGAGPFIIDATTYLFGAPQGGLYYTSDAGENWDNVGPGADHQMYKASDGSYYVGSDFGMHHSTDSGASWTKIDGAQNGYGIVGDGTRIFNSLRNAGDKQPYYVSNENDGQTWTKLASPEMNQGGVYMAYDADHHLLYSANTGSGFWRMKTQ